MDKTTQLSKERLAEIGKRAVMRWNRTNLQQIHSVDELPRRSDIKTLLDEVERQRVALDAAEAREAALLAVARAVAEADSGETGVRTIWTDGAPIWTHGRWAYVPVESQEQARAVLASTEQEGGGDGA